LHARNAILAIAGLKPRPDVVSGSPGFRNAILAIEGLKSLSDVVSGRVSRGLAFRSANWSGGPGAARWRS
jgi:hypothetical protein